MADKFSLVKAQAEPATDCIVVVRDNNETAGKSYTILDGQTLKVKTECATKAEYDLEIKKLYLERRKAEQNAELKRMQDAIDAQEAEEQAQADSKTQPATTRSSKKEAAATTEDK